MNNPPEIIYQDENYVAMNKPSGLLVHRSMIDRHETQFALQIMRDHLGQRVYPLHRLDKPTSGVLLFALHQDMARKMMPLFSGKQVNKRYVSIVRGYTEEQGLIDYPLKEQLDKISDADADQDKEAQDAITSYRRLEMVELPIAVGRYETARYSLVELLPQTGRRHQLRRHMKHIFHPIVGDTTHGDGKQNQLFRRQWEINHLMLHARELSFVCPETQADICIRASFDEGWKRLFDIFNWPKPV
ncbi:MAG: tRNA pseudouridine(65) synthase TruC [Gammaproteobacteria bacterium]|nr:tRNA pseudouridine(65) synthase TruC [Gammaproteobacteria bacterium]